MKDKLKNFDKRTVIKIAIGILIAILVIGITVVMLKKKEKPNKENVEYKAESVTVVPDGYTGIYAVADLDNIRNDLAGNYILMADIDMSGISNFTPIGDSTNAFTGIFDGNCYKIKNLNIESSNQYIGLFGYINSGTVSNLTIENANVKSVYNGTAANHIGILAGYVKGTRTTVSTVKANINNIDVIGNSTVEDIGAKGTCYMGGLIGYAYSNLDTENCSTKVTIKDEASSGNTVYIGGLIGYTYNGATVKNSYSKPEIEAKNRTANVGGLIGYQGGTIENAYAIGKIDIGTNSSGNILLGGLVGYQYANITNAYTKVEIVGKGASYTRVGGISGNNNSRVVANTYAVGKISVERANKGGIAGLNSGTINNSYWSPEAMEIRIEDTNEEGEPRLMYEMLKQSNYNSWDFSTVWGYREGSLPYLLGIEEEEIKKEKFNYIEYNGEGTDVNPYLIYTVEQFRGISKTTSVTTYKLMKDIDFTGISDYRQIGNYKKPFKGNLDGNNYKISNLNIELSEQYIGIFGYINGGTISNLTIENSSVKSTYNGIEDNYIGILAGYIKGKTSNEEVNINNINIIGNNIVENINARGKSYLGGIIGYGQVNMENCNAKVVIKDEISSDKMAYIGGLIGGNSGTVKNCYSKPQITAKNRTANVGGLIGYQHGPIENAYAICKIDIKEKDVNVGGLIGSQSGPLTNVYAIGKINIGDKDVNVGGLVGYQYANITNAYTKVEIVGDGSSGTNVGGISGNNNSRVVVNTYAVGKISVSNGNKGGIIGADVGTVNNSYWAPEAMEIRGEDTNSKGEARLMHEMLKQSNYNGWDFSTVWGYKEESLPYLLGNEEDEIKKDKFNFVEYNGEGTEANPYLIYTVEQFKAISSSVKATYKLMQDLDCTGVDNYIPIGDLEYPFEGKLDGNNHKILNLNIESSLPYVGIFGYLKSAVISDLDIINIKIKTYRDTENDTFYGCGLLAGEVGGDSSTKSKICNTKTVGSINLSENACSGGLIGRCTYGIVEYCSSKVEIYINNNNIRIQDYGDSKIINGNGGLIGYADNSIINNSYTKLQIKGKVCFGGFGGVIGFVTSNTYVTNVYAIGNINIDNSDVKVGGIAGILSGYSIMNAFSNVNIKGEGADESFCGGIVGWNYKSSLIQNTYAVGRICVDKGKLGGIVGTTDNNSNSIYNSYWCQQTVQLTSNGRGTPKTLDEMLCKDTYYNWDFIDTWKIDDNTMPYLLGNKEKKICREYIDKGTEDNPYIINNEQDFVDFLKENTSGEYYEIINELNFNNISIDEADSNRLLMANLDGKNNVIKNLEIDSNNSKVAIFKDIYQERNYKEYKI